MKDFKELREAAFGRARFNQQLKKKGIDTNKMHSTNVKDAAAAKQRSKDAAKDHADFKKKNSNIKFNENAKEIEEISVGMQQRYKKKAMKQYKDSGRKKEVGGVGMTTKQSTADKHMNRYMKRHRGIGSVIKRDGGSERTVRNPGMNTMTKNKAPYRNEAVTEGEFVPHMMYNPKTGKGYKAETEKDHLQMKKMGYSHEAPDVKEAKGEDGKGHYRATDSGAGMTQKGVDAVNRKTGGNLQTAVTGNPKAGSKDAGRRKSFCARMGGMKGPMKDDDGKPTRKAQSLKRWKC